MSFDKTIAQVEQDAITDRLAAKQYLQNILDLIASQATGIVPTVETDIVSFARNYIPQTATAALKVFDEISTGFQAPIEAFATSEIAIAIVHARDLLNSLVPSTPPATLAPNTITATEKTSTETVTESLPHS
jgi:hypothetical protein